jgi:hypothetical protein
VSDSDMIGTIATRAGAMCGLIAACFVAVGANALGAAPAQAGLLGLGSALLAYMCAGTTVIVVLAVLFNLGGGGDGR